MSSENNKLPDFLVADLYKDCLVDLDSFPITEAVTTSFSEPRSLTTDFTPEKNKIKYLGENKQKVTVLVKDEDSVIINQGDLLFLTNVLKACNLNAGDIAIINTASQKFDYKDITAQLDPKHILLFDVEPQEINLPFTIPNFQVQPYNGITYLKAPALVEINQPTDEAKVLKRSLWEKVQKIFELSR